MRVGQKLGGEREAFAMDAEVVCDRLVDVRHRIQAVEDVGDGEVTQNRRQGVDGQRKDGGCGWRRWSGRFRGGAGATRTFGGEGWMGGGAGTV